MEKRDDRWIISVLSGLQAKPLMVHQMRISLVHVSSSESAEGRSSNDEIDMYNCVSSAYTITFSPCAEMMSSMGAKNKANNKGPKTDP